MAKTSLSNQLLGKKICPSKILLEREDQLKTFWGLKPSMDGTYLATIEAAWHDGEGVRVLASGPYGDIKEICMLNVLIEFWSEGKGKL